MTILVHFHQSQYRCFKAYYLNEVYRHLRGAFPDLPGYTRVLALTPSVLVPLCAYLQQRKGTATGIAFIDATSIVVCHNRRIHSHEVFKKLARRGKTSVGWFCGFNRAQPPSQCCELHGQPGRWLGCLHPSAQETLPKFNAKPREPVDFGVKIGQTLSRTDVKFNAKPRESVDFGVKIGQTLSRTDV